MGHREHIVLDGEKYLLVNPRGHQHSLLMPWTRKTGGGDTRYSNFDKWAVRAFTDTHVGRGEEWDEGLDGRFLDADRVCTRYKGRVMLGARHQFVLQEAQVVDETVTTGIFSTEQRKLFHIGWKAGYQWLGQSFQFPNTVKAYEVGVWVSPNIKNEYGLPTDLGPLTIGLYTDNGGKPGSKLDEVVITGAEFLAKYGYGIALVDEALPLAPVELTGGVTYWLTVSTPVTGYGQPGYFWVSDPQQGYASGEGKRAADFGDAWVAVNADFWFFVQGELGAIGQDVETFLDGEVVDICEHLEGSTWKLMVLAGKKVYMYDAVADVLDEEPVALSGDGVRMRVYKGVLYVSQGNDGPVRKKSGTTWGYDSEQGALSYTVEGAMKTFTDDAQDFNDWKVTSGNAAYAIVVKNSDGTVSWGFLGNVVSATEIKVFQDVFLNTTGWNGTDPSGKTPFSYHVSASWKAGVMEVAPDLDGDLALWVQGAGVEDPYDRTLQVRSTVDGHQFSDWIQGPLQSPTTYIGWYAGEVWIANWHEIGSIDPSLKKYVPQFQFPSQRAPQNFAASCVWHKNDLMLNILDSVWHWSMGSQFRNIGPTKGIGLPKDRLGVISAMLPLVNRLLVAVDAGNADGRYSSILSYNGVGDVGWHNEFKSEVANDRIRAMFYTPLGHLKAGMEPRLWFGHGRSLGYMPMPDVGDDPGNWEPTDYYYVQGRIIFACFDGLIRHVDKDWSAIRLGCTGIDDYTFVDIFYRLNWSPNVWADGGWERLGTIGSENSVASGDADVSPTNNLATLLFGENTVSKVIQLCPVLRSLRSGKTPIVLLPIEIKWWPAPDQLDSWTMTLNLIDWSDDEGIPHRWEKQQANFWATVAKKEPVSFIDIYGNAWTVKLDPAPREVPLIEARSDQPTGCQIQVWMVKA